eukprot:scaffold22146_cov69-Phaeocystis_antarctica.AAC.3
MSTATTANTHVGSFPAGMLHPSCMRRARSPPWPPPAPPGAPPPWPLQGPCGCGGDGGGMMSSSEFSH